MCDWRVSLLQWRAVEVCFEDVLAGVLAQLRKRDFHEARGRQGLNTYRFVIAVARVVHEVRVGFLGAALASSDIAVLGVEADEIFALHARERVEQLLEVGLLHELVLILWVVELDGDVLVLGAKEVRDR